tara:strand:+ start:7444 stop:9465 length:2022 start_codon:yes stop_codon:yes gene_type:complete
MASGLSAGPPTPKSENNADMGYSSDEDDILYAPKVSYKKRKEEIAEKENPSLDSDGIEYCKNEPLISELFNTKQLPQEVHTKYKTYDVNRSYIYIISKKVDGRTFIKIGMSKLGNSKQKISTRLESAQTFLIPGLENNGFKLHYVFFYRREAVGTGTSFAELIERRLHQFLKVKYERAIIHHSTNRASEWYLPDVTDYEEFIDDALMFISVQNPVPEEAYHFKRKGTRSKKIVREHKDIFLKSQPPEKVIEHRHDFIAAKKEKATEASTRPQTRRGNKKYFMDKLVNSPKPNTPPLGDKLTIVDIYYHRSATDSLRIFGDYYAQIINSQTRDANKTPSGIILSYTTDNSNEKKYFSHISHILDAMHELNTIETYGLLHNYNYYHNYPIKIAKLFLNRESGANYKYVPSLCKWLLDRIVRDTENRLYRAVDIKTSRNNYVSKIVYHEIHEQNFKIKRPLVVKKADPMIAIKLTVDYHDNIKHELVKYKIDNSPNTTNQPVMRDEKYALFDFVKFNKNYFKQDGKDDPKQYIGVILQKKWNNATNSDTQKKEFEYQYEILFDNNQIWEFNTEEVDKNSKKFVNTRGIQTFLDNAQFKKNAMYHLYERYGIPHPDVQAASSALPTPRLRVARPQASTRKNNSKQQQSRRKVYGDMLRRSARLATTRRSTRKRKIQN